MSVSPLRFALLQARSPQDPARDEEHAAFAARLSLPPQAIRAVDIFTQPLDQALLDGTDVLLVGGAGEYSVLDDLPPIHRFIDFLGEAAAQGRPTFASCFGFQALVLALGGEVISAPDRAEVGSYTLWRTPEASDDPLFGTLPDTFIAQLGHKDQASRLPDAVLNLASSERTVYQALRVRGAPVYATQFHPELTWLDNRRRFERYMPIYGKLFGEAEAQERLDSHTPGPESNTLIARFVDEIARPALQGGEGTQP